MSRADGVGGLIRASVAQALPQAPPVEQAELFNLPLVQRPGDLLNGKLPETDAEFAARSARVQDAARRGRGRPKGAQSVSTSEWRNFALKHGPHPVVAMMRWLDLGPHGLAEELDIPLVAAFDRWSTLARELAPYFMAKQAPVDDQGKAVPGLAMFVGNVGINTEAGGLKPWHVAFETVDGDMLDLPAGPSDDTPADEAAPAQPEEPAP